jgi:hypothetical protein
VISFIRHERGALLINERAVRSTPPGPMATLQLWPLDHWQLGSNIDILFKLGILPTQVIVMLILEKIFMGNARDIIKNVYSARQPLLTAATLY